MKVAVIMGSNSDFDIMKDACHMLDKLQVPYECQVVSAHRTPEKMFEFARNAKINGFSVIIAGAGGAAHLAGMVASLTILPVIGVPIESKSLKGMDSLLSIVQMPAGVPVATVAINGAKNAAILAASIFALTNPIIQKNLEQYKSELVKYVEEHSRIVV
jgi:5-(carboxyamino)imidazole ribonucleotide mutase